MVDTNKEGEYWAVSEHDEKMLVVEGTFETILEWKSV